MVRIQGLLFALALCAGSRTDASPSIEDFVELTDLSSLGVSPDGRFVLFRTERADLERNSYELRWHSYDADSGKVLDIASAGDPIYDDPGLIEENRPVWLADGRSFAFRALVDGAVGVWKSAADRSGATPLIVRDSDVEQLDSADHGTALLYSLGPSRDEVVRSEKAEYDSGIKVDGSVDLAQNLYRGGSIGGRMASQRFVGYWFVRGPLLWRAPRQTYRLMLRTGQELPVGAARSPDPFRVPATGSARRGDGSEASARWDGTRGEVRARIGGGPEILCADRRCRTNRIAWLAWRPGADQLVLASIDRNRRQSLWLWDVRSQHLNFVASAGGLLSGDRWSYVPCALSREAAFCVAAGPASPPLLERIDLGSGRQDIVFDPNAGLRAAYRPKVEQLSWRGRSGYVFHGTLLTPSARELRGAPLFVNYYKCDGFLRGGEGDSWPIANLLESGFAVACVNAASFSGAQDAVSTYRMGLDGVESLVRMLSARGLVDTHKVGMGGFSFGSEVATWIATHSNLLAVLSIDSAQFEPGAYWIDTLGAPDRARMIRQVWHLGAPDQTPGRWTTVSPALNARTIHAATLMQLPEQEARRIPELAARLIASPTPAELFAFPDEDHIIVQPRHRRAVYRRNLDWFRYWLQGFSDPDPSKADQYRRWDRLEERLRRSAPPRAHP